MTPLSSSSLFAVLLLLVPPTSPPTDPTIQHLEMMGVELQGRDPCSGTEFHCGLLPVCQPSDVYYMTYPRHVAKLTDFVLAGHFPNLKRVSCERTISKKEYDTLIESVSATALFNFRVRLNDGTTTRVRRIDPRIIRHDTDFNGDGVVNEDDWEYPEAE